MKLADVTFTNEPYYFVTIPEYKDAHNIKVHVFRYDIPGKGWRSMQLKYPSGGVVVKEASNTSYQSFDHTNEVVEFKEKVVDQIRVERNIIQIHNTKIENTKESILQEINQKLHVGFENKIFTLEEFEKYLVNLTEEGEYKEIAERTLKNYRLINEAAGKQNIAKYFLLFTLGGIYMDPRSVIRMRFDEKYFRLNLYDGFISLYGNNSTPDLGLLACKKNSPLLKLVLEKALTNVENRFYGSHEQEPTGNLCFKECIEKLTSVGFLSKDLREIRHGDEKFFILREDSGRLYDDRNKLIWNKDVYVNSIDRKLGDMFRLPQNLWSYSQFYTEGNPTPTINWTTATTALAIALGVIAFLFFYTSGFFGKLIL